MAAYVVTTSLSDIDAFHKAIEEGRRARRSRMAGFISQDKFNAIVRTGTFLEVADAVNKYPEMVIGFDSQNMSPLMAAADRDGIGLMTLDNVVALLIKAGARMDGGSFSSTSPLCYAATKPACVFGVFIKYETNWSLYASFSHKPWQIALYSSAEKFLMIMPYMPREAFMCLNANGYTLLIDVIFERPAAVTAALANRYLASTVNTPDHNGETPLAHAAKLDRYRELVTRALLRKGATLLYKRGRKAICYTEVRNDRTPGVEYMRDRITHPTTSEPFDHLYDHWYE